MGIESGKCPHCGGALLLDSMYIKATCKFCKAEIIVKEALEKLSEGLIHCEHLCLLAEQSIEFDEDYDKARNLYREALVYNPNDFRILWGLFLCEVDCIFYYKNYKGYVQMPGDLYDCYAKVERLYGQRAYASAPEEIKPRYWAEMQKLPTLLVGKRKLKKIHK